MQITSTMEKPRKSADLAEPDATGSMNSEPERPHKPVHRSDQASQVPDQTSNKPTGRRKSLETPGHRIIPPRDPISPSNPSRRPLGEVPPTPPEADVPLRSDALSPTRPHPPHFSYPSHAQPGQVRDEPQQAGPAPSRVGQHPEHSLQGQSTISNLKMAAAGLHGAGEALRGTVNSVVDRRLGADQETMRKNEAAIQAGRYEIENRRFYREHDVKPDEVRMQSDALQATELEDTDPTTQREGRGGGSHSSSLGGILSQKVSKSRLGDRLGNFVKVSSASQPEDSGREQDVHELQAAPVRRPAKLQKRSSSMLSVVGE